MYPYFSKNEESNKNTNKEVKVTSYKDELDYNTLDKQDDFENYVLDMLLEAIEQENYDMRYYEQLSTIVEGDKPKEILRRIHLEDTKHFNMLSELYKKLTGKEPIFEYDEVDIDDNLKEEIADAIEQKLENVELYRNLLSSFLDIDIRDMIFEIITDEQAQAQRLGQLQL